jgi:hypothetical protein
MRARSALLSFGEARVDGEVASVAERYAEAWRTYFSIEVARLVTQPV